MAPFGASAFTSTSPTVRLGSSTPWKRPVALINPPAVRNRVTSAGLLASCTVFGVRSGLFWERKCGWGCETVAGAIDTADERGERPAGYNSQVLVQRHVSENICQTLSITAGAGKAGAWKRQKKKGWHFPLVPTRASSDKA